MRKNQRRTDFILDRDYSVADLPPIVRSEEHGLPGTEQWSVSGFLDRSPSTKWYLLAEEEKATLIHRFWRSRTAGRLEGIVIGFAVGMLLTAILWLIYG